MRSPAAKSWRRAIGPIRKIPTPRPQAPRRWERKRGSVAQDFSSVTTPGRRAVCTMRRGFMPEPSARHIRIVDTSASMTSALRPVGLDAVQLEPGFWAERRELNREVTLRAVLRQLEQSGRLGNFERAADRLDTAYEGKYYGDSDVYKWLEAAGWTLATDEDPELLSEVDRVVDLVCAAQKPDGYLNTYFSGSRSSERWTDLPKMHELYCAGHLIQAAIALRRATGKSRLFDAAGRVADLIDSVFGPDRKRGACGHPGVEVALVELARETNDRRYLNF